MLTTSNESALPTTRQEAIRLNLPRFNNGRPCKYGHFTDRYTVSGSCVGCHSPRLLLSRKPRVNQFTLTYTLPANVLPTADMFKFMAVKLHTVQRAWFDEFYDSQLTMDDLEATEMGHRAGGLAALTQAGWTIRNLLEGNMAREIL